LAVTGTSGSLTHTTTVTLKIVPASSQLVVTVTTNKPSYTKGSYVIISVRVTDGNGSPISGASVEVRVYYPGSTVYQKFTGNTNTSGYFTAYFRTSYSMPVGTYTVTATATKTGYLSGSGSTTFRLI